MIYPALFLLGFGYEILYLLWLSAADRGYPGPAALLSVAVSTISIFGIVEVAHRGWLLALPLILGYGAGSYAAGLYRLHQRRVGLRLNADWKPRRALRPPSQ